MRSIRIEVDVLDAGKEGTSIALVGGRDKYKLIQIEKTIKCRIERKMIPSGEEVMKAMVFKSIDNLINARVHPKALKPFREAIHELSGQMTVTDVLEKFIALHSSKILNFYKDAKDLNSFGKSRRDKKSSDSQRIFINIGEKDGFDWATLKDLLREKTALTNDDFGGVDVKSSFSFFNVSKSKVVGVFEAFDGFSVGDRKVTLELTKTSKSTEKKVGSRDRRRRREIHLEIDEEVLGLRIDLVLKVRENEENNFNPHCGVGLLFNSEFINLTYELVNVLINVY